MNRNIKHHLLATLLCVVFTAEVRAQGTDFTCQGRLQDGGQPAAGPLDLAFRLYNAAAAGAQIGPELEQLNFEDFGEGGE